MKPISPIRLISPIRPIPMGLILGLILFLAFIEISSWDKVYSGEKLLLNEERFDKFIRAHFSSEDSPAKDASLEILKIDDDYIIRLKPCQEGLEVNRTLLKLELKEYLRDPNLPPLTDLQVPLTKSYPKIRDYDVANARMKAYQILATPVSLEYQDQSWEVPREEIAEWLEFVGKASLSPADNADLGRSRGYPSYQSYPTYPLNPPESAGSATLAVRLDTQKIKNFITPLASEINEEPINAQLSLNYGKVVAFALSREGKRLEIEESAQIIASNISTLRSSATAEDGQHLTSNIQLTVSTLTPQVTTESIDNLGITSLIGKGESNFAGSPRNRVHNIKLSTAKFNGTLIKPAEVFSFNGTLGEVGPTGGYLPELVIKRDKTIPEFGGGICQVSTTLFRAALFSGLPITERFPHAFPVAYYWPQGMDATVYDPHPDLKFKNDTPGHILIQRKIIGTKLIFEMFGTSDREVKIKGPYVIEKKEDGSMKTVLYREIYHDGELVKKETFWSNYASPTKYPISEN